MEQYAKLSAWLSSLVLFRPLRQDPAMAALERLLASAGLSGIEQADRYAAFAHALFAKTESLTEYVWWLLVVSENAAVREISSGRPVSAALRACLQNELAIWQEVARLDAKELAGRLSFEGFLPAWQVEQRDFAAEYESHLANLGKTGFGIFYQRAMLTFQNGKIRPVSSPDPVRLEALSGYAFERGQVLQNTRALLAGGPAANLLLYGDAGTGKSSTVKAVVNELAAQGLRLVEVGKGELLRLPELMGRLAENPLKFIVFVDDLSFAKANEEIGALKAILEGSVSARPANAVIYATSNRRRLVRETFSEREGDDVHRSETIQEQISLSERFGMSVLFARPDKEEYLSIVLDLARQYGLQNSAGLESHAERYALERGGRSGRTARQFVEYVKQTEALAQEC